eukprot:6171854-Pleurochrysis_carterae.AAC.1
MRRHLSLLDAYGSSGSKHILRIPTVVELFYGGRPPRQHREVRTGRSPALPPHPSAPSAPSLRTNLHQCKRIINPRHKLGQTACLESPGRCLDATALRSELSKLWTD